MTCIALVLGFSRFKFELREPESVGFLSEGFLTSGEFLMGGGSSVKWFFSVGN